MKSVPAKKVAVVQPRITQYFNRITMKEAQTLNQAAQANKLNEVLKRNKELEKEIRTLKNRINDLSAENKDLRKDLDTGANSNKKNTEVIQENSGKRKTNKSSVTNVSKTQHLTPEPARADKTKTNYTESKNEANAKAHVKISETRTKNRPTESVNKNGGASARNQKKDVVVIAGDSIVKGQKGWLMSRTKHVKC